MRRLLRDIAAGQELGDVTTLRDPTVMEQLAGEDRGAGSPKRTSGSWRMRPIAPAARRRRRRPSDAASTRHRRACSSSVRSTAVQREAVALLGRRPRRGSSPSCTVAPRLTRQAALDVRLGAARCRPACRAQPREPRASATPQSDERRRRPPARLSIGRRAAARRQCCSVARSSRRPAAATRPGGRGRACARAPAAPAARSCAGRPASTHLLA